MTWKRLCFWSSALKKNKSCKTLTKNVSSFVNKFFKIIFQVVKFACILFVQFTHPSPISLTHSKRKILSSWQQRLVAAAASIMTSILDMKTSGFDYWTEISNFFMPLKNLITNDTLIQDVNFIYLTNAMFWTFSCFSLGFAGFLKVFQIFSPNFSCIKFYKRTQFVRSIWNTAFHGASALFLYFYNEFMISPQLTKNAGRFSLFPSAEDSIFYRSQQCGKFQFYSLFIITFYLHGAILDFMESDILEAASKSLYLMTLLSINSYKYENYFVGLNLNVGIYNIITEFLFILALQSAHRSRLLNQVFLGLRIASWSHIFISLLPFKYLVPTLFAKNFKIPLNISFWLWYGLSIWNSPVLQYFYHQIYHTSPIDCSGEGSAAKCILLKDSSEYRHFKCLKKAYLEVKLAHEKKNTNALAAPTNESSSAKAFQAIKCIMTLKKKLKRIREGRGGDNDDADDMTSD